MTTDAIGGGVEAAWMVEPLAAPQLRVGFGGVADVAVSFLPLLAVAFEAGELPVLAPQQLSPVALGAVAHALHRELAVGDPPVGFGVAADLGGRALLEATGRPKEAYS